MVHRRHNGATILVSQPAHAWLSGHLARAWGNEEFQPPEPFDEVVLATELHDVGFLDWELEPTLNKHTGLPHSFLDLPPATHFEIWSRGVKRMMAYSRYATLLCSRHYSGLLQRHPKTEPREAEMAQGFLDTQSSLQHLLLKSLQRDSQYAAFSTEAVLARNSRLLSIWDWISLLLCGGFSGDQIIEEVPARETSVQLTLHPVDPDALRVQVTPWPFQSDQLQLTIEGRCLSATFAEQDTMRTALRAAAPVVVSIELVSKS